MSNRNASDVTSYLAGILKHFLSTMKADGSSTRSTAAKTLPVAHATAGPLAPNRQYKMDHAQSVCIFVNKSGLVGDCSLRIEWAVDHMPMRNYERGARTFADYNQISAIASTDHGPKEYQRN